MWISRFWGRWETEAPMPGGDGYRAVWPWEQVVASMRKGNRKELYLSRGELRPRQLAFPLNPTGWLQATVRAWIEQLVQENLLCFRNNSAAATDRTGQPA